MPKTLIAPRSTRHRRTRTSMKRELFSVAEFCEQYNISHSHFYAQRAKGNGPRAVRIGRRLLIPKANAAAWIRSLEEHAA